MADPKREQIHNPATEHGVDPTSRVGKPQSAYAGSYRPGDEWFNEEQNVMDNRRTNNTPTGEEYVEGGRARQMQLQDQSRESAKGVAGAMPPSYKSGGIVRRTGMAMVHQGEKIIPKEQVQSESTRVISPAGNLVCPKNAGAYTGENQPWRR